MPPQAIFRLRRFICITRHVSTLLDFSWLCARFGAEDAFSVVALNAVWPAPFGIESFICAVSAPKKAPVHANMTMHRWKYSVAYVIILNQVKLIKGWRMDIVIIGNGKVGATIAKILAEEGHNLVIIDEDADSLSTTSNELDVMVVEGNGSDAEVLKGARVDAADLVIAVTSSDEINILCCIISKKLGAKRTVARVRQPEYKALGDIMDELGIDFLINPELAAAEEITNILQFPSASKIEIFEKDRVELVEVVLPAGNILCQKALSSLYSEFSVKILISTVTRNGKAYIPTGSFVLQEGDRIGITAAPAEIHKFLRAVNLHKTTCKTVMIAGGSKIAFYLANNLEKNNTSVKIIERSYERCTELSEKLPKTIIINGDVSNEALLREENIAESDAFVALTGIDEENVIISMYAAAAGVSKVVMKINKISFSGVLERTGIDCVISPKTIVAHQIVQYVRSIQNTEGNNVLTYKRIASEKVEALEFNVTGGCRLVGVALKDLNIKNDILIVSIVKDGKVIVPGGGDVIEAGNNVIVVSIGHRLQDIEDILN